MNEEQIKEIMNELVEQARKSHMVFLEDNLRLINNSFLKGIEVGINIKKNND